MVSKMLLSSCELDCSEEIVTIAAVLSVQVNLSTFLLLVNINEKFQNTFAKHQK
jgi:HrpA-like RNA helicase